MSFLNKKQNYNCKYLYYNNSPSKLDIISRDYEPFNHTYNYPFKNIYTKNNFNETQNLSEENPNISNINDTLSLNNKRVNYKTYYKDNFYLNTTKNIKQNINRKNFIYPSQENYNYENLNKNLNLKNSRMKNIEYKISQIKSELSTINNDNLMMKEDIYKYTDMNQYIQNQIKIQQEHNKDLLNKNQNLIQENEILSQQLEQDEQELSELIQENENKHKLFDDNQMCLEIKNEKVNKDYDELISINNKVKNDYESLCINYEELNKKNKEINNEIKIMKEMQNKQFIDIGEKINEIISQIDILKNEKNMLLKEKEEKKNKLEIINKKKEDFYNKYQEQVRINDNISKKLYDEKIALGEIKKKLDENKEKKEKTKKRNNSLDKRKGLIKELQKKIENYKYKSLKNSYTEEFSF